MIHIEANRRHLLATIRTAALRHAERPALVIEEKVYTYAQLFRQVAVICRRLEGYAGNVVGVTGENTMETYASLLAAWFTGKAYVILHPDYPAERNRQIVGQAGIGLVLYARQDILPDDLPIPRCCTAEGATADEGCPDLLPDTFLADTTAYIIFTSGSTGTPKGVPISHANLDAFYAAYRSLGWKLNENDRLLQMFELTFDVSVVSFFYPLTLGACVYTVPQEGMKYLQVLDLMERHRLTFAAVAPSVLRLARPYFHELSFPDLRYLVVTAEASDADLLEAFRPCIPHAEIINLYGPTEATIYCTRYTMPAHGCKQHNGMVAIGKTFAGMKAVIVGEDGQPLPTDTTGELWLSGPQLMTGYWQQPELTAQCFVRRDGRLYYRTGDLCRRDADGDLIYCGRKDNQVKIQGFRIELGEIEHCAKEFYAHRCNAVVLALQGEGGCELHLVVERAPEDTAALMQHLQSRLPAYMLPKRIHFLPVFPLNKSNKTDRPRIRQLIG